MSLLSSSKTELMQINHPKFPRLVKLPVFGNQFQTIDLEYPTQLDLVSFPPTEKIQLKEILYQRHDVLMGIQLRFTEDVETPLF